MMNYQHVRVKMGEKKRRINLAKHRVPFPIIEKALLANLRFKPDEPDTSKKHTDDNRDVADENEQTEDQWWSYMRLGLDGPILRVTWAIRADAQGRYTWVISARKWKPDEGH